MWRVREDKEVEAIPVLRGSRHCSGVDATVLLLSKGTIRKYTRMNSQMDDVGTEC